MPYSACSLGFSPKKIERLIGVAKIYDTKSGVDPLFPESLWEDKILNQIIEEGQEFGSTTGRKRLVNWLNLDKLIAAIKLSGCTELYINKCDVLESVGTFRLKYEGALVNFEDIIVMKDFIKYYIKEQTDVKLINFSGSKEYANI
jgi:adenylosuccinate synthase